VFGICNRVIHLKTGDYWSSAPPEGSSAASIFESRCMLVAWTSATRQIHGTAAWMHLY